MEQGMDVPRGRGIAGQLRSQGSALESLSAQGTAMMQVLEEVWSGPDSGGFAQDWHSARPALDAASQAVTDLGEQLNRQADEQERASDGSGRAAALGGSALPGASAVAAASSLPTVPDVVDAIGDFFEGVWDWLRSPWFSFPSWLNDVVGWLDDAYKWLQRVPLIRTGVRFIGKVAIPIALFMGGYDIGYALARIYKYGWSTDAGLQLLQGLTGLTAAVLGGVAIFATGTILGAPAGLVLGGLALGFAALSMGISLARQYPERTEKALEESGLGRLLIWPGMPGSPYPEPDPWRPSLPKPQVPDLPSLPDVPRMPNPWVPVPTLGG